MAKAFLINGAEKSISPIEFDADEAMAELIGYESVIADPLDGEGDNKVFFDEDCFIRGHEGRFQIDTLPPISGIAVVMAGSDTNPQDSSLDLAAITARLKWL